MPKIHTVTKVGCMQKMVMLGKGVYRNDIYRGEKKIKAKLLLDTNNDKAY